MHSLAAGAQQAKKSLASRSLSLARCLASTKIEENSLCSLGEKAGSCLKR